MFTLIGFAGPQSAQPAMFPLPKPPKSVLHMAKPLASDLFFRGQTNQEETPEEQIPKLTRQCQKKGWNLQSLLNEATIEAAAQGRDMLSVYAEILKQKLVESSAKSPPKAETTKTPRKILNTATSRPTQAIVPNKASVKASAPPPVIIESSGDEMDTDSDSASPETIIQKLEKKCKQKNIEVKDIQSTVQAIIEAEGRPRRKKGEVVRQQTVYISLLRDALEESRRNVSAQKERNAQLQELVDLKEKAQRCGINVAEIEQRANDKNDRSYDRGNIYHRDKFFIRYLQEALEMEQDADGEEDDILWSHYNSPIIS